VRLPNEKFEGAKDDVYKRLYCICICVYVVAAGTLLMLDAWLLCWWCAYGPIATCGFVPGRTLSLYLDGIFEYRSFSHDMSNLAIILLGRLRLTC
jgi:hypothetical protein